jgi:hypothetical protein
MVTVVNVRQRDGQNGPFIALDLMGSVEMVQSQSTGKFYATARKCSIPSTFDEETAKRLIGSKFPGSIKRVECDTYNYTVEGGEIIELNHTYVYSPEEETVLTTSPVVSMRQVA